MNGNIVGNGKRERQCTTKLKIIEYFKSSRMIAFGVDVLPLVESDMTLNLIRKRLIEIIILQFIDI